MGTRVSQVEIGNVFERDQNRIFFLSFFFCILKLNPQAPVAQKSADELVFRHFKGEKVEFF